jgi:hypothetical protein
MSKTTIDPKDQILGVWRLLSFDLKSDASERASVIAQPYGPKPLGRIFFTSGGYMNATLTNPEPSKSFEPTLTMRTALDKDVAAVARSLTTYCGPFETYEENGQIMLSTDVHVALDPTFYGTKQVRRVQFKSEEGHERLVLSPVDLVPLPVS